MKKSIKLILFIQLSLMSSLIAQNVIIGTVMTTDNDAMVGVSVELLNGDEQFLAALSTSQDGAFELNVPQAGEYYLVFDFDGNPLNGISTYDMVLIAKYILGLGTNNSAYTLLAMDLNGNGVISVMDVLILRRMVLGIYLNFPVHNWIFLEELENPDDISTVGPINIIPVSVTEGETLHLSIIGVKVGDVN